MDGNKVSRKVVGEDVCERRGKQLKMLEFGLSESGVWRRW